ncbi:NAD-dependent deacetylase [Dongia sp.]|uniref:SIR2 family NAD-dependent protein deacylase n=1 Tax=Dongia sp. TaxID=1977262 RepID=UPI00375061C6
MEFAPALIEQLRHASRVVFFTGAGVSAESGLPTFRDAQTGLWANYKPQDLATPEAFARDPQTVWRWYQWRRRVHADVTPNPAHHAIAAFEARLPEAVLVTQNVDRLHELAGSPAPIHLHGSVFRNKCASCGIEMPEVPHDLETPPACPDCGGLCRPDVVWFGEGLPPAPWQAAVDAAVKAEVVISIGTSATVHPAARIPLVAREAGALVVQVNPEPTPQDKIALNLRGKAGAVLPALLAAVWGE